MSKHEACQQTLMYGCDMKQFKDSVLKSASYKFSGGGLILVSILSDVQEMIERGMKEEARQHINRVKSLIMDAEANIDPQHIQF
jgi:hypothetical protein